MFWELSNEFLTYISSRLASIAASYELPVGTETAIFSPMGGSMVPSVNISQRPFIGTVHDRGVTSSRRWKTSRFLSSA